MGAFRSICQECGQVYWWYSFNPAYLTRAKKCDECWRKQGVKPETFKVEP